MGKGRAVRLVNIGYGNAVVAERVVAIVSPESAPMKRFKEEARKLGRLIDGTQGRRTRSIVAERLERGTEPAGSPSPSTQSPPAPEPELQAGGAPAQE